MHPNVYSSIVYNSQDIWKATYVSINRWMDNEDVVHIYTMEYYSAIKKNEILPFAATWMDLEDIMLSEVKSDRERQILQDITHMCNLKKDNKLVNITKNKQIHRYREQTTGYQLGGGAV